MDNKYLEKTIECLKDLNKCLNDDDRKGFYGINNNIYSLMFNDAYLKPEFTLMLPNHLSGYFASIMWSISRTGAYFGPVISSYKVEDIKKCINELILELEKNLDNNKK